MIDVEINRLLDRWEPHIGRPTCAAGCSRCCERMTVTISSAEALELVDEAPQFVGRVEAAVARLPSKASLNDLLDLGPCVYLEGGRCGVYGLRPDACRACYVWHDARYCGRQDFDMCTPAELNSLRLKYLCERMAGELERGRRPFRGYLLPAVWLMQRRREEYLAGVDVREERFGELLEFPAVDELERERAELEAVFASEENPMGFPRAERARDRAMLAAFDLRV